MSDDEDRGRGRPSKLTADTIELLHEALEQGASYEHAADYAGIGASTFREWRARGVAAAPGDEEFVEFLAALKSAEARGAMSMLKTLDAATAPEAKMAWQAAAWKLERRWPKDYGKSDRVEHSGPDGGPIQYEDMTPEERRKRTDELLARRRAAD